MIQIVKKMARVYSLTGRITSKLMKQSFKAVKRNRGAAGIDKVSVKMFEANLEQNLKSLEKDLKDGSYRPSPLKRVYIPKGNSLTQFRPLGIPIVRDRVAQEVVRHLLNPIFDKLFHSSSHGFRLLHSCHTAMQELMSLHEQGYNIVVEADIKGFFDNLSHQLILDMIQIEVSDSNVINLVQKFLQAGVIEEGVFKPTVKGTPQGGVISPLLANIVLNHLDWTLQEQGFKFVRYADDFVVLCKSKAQAEKALLLIKSVVQDDLALEIHPDKTKITSFKEGFVFLGYLLSPMGAKMSPKAEERFKDKVRSLTVRSQNLDSMVVDKVNRLIRGTVNYFAISFARAMKQFNLLDSWVRKRIRCMKFKRISYADNWRLHNRAIRRMGFLTCKEIYLAAIKG